MVAGRFVWGATKFVPTAFPKNGGVPEVTGNVSAAVPVAPITPVVVTVGATGATGGGNPEADTAAAGFPGFTEGAPKIGRLKVLPTAGGGVARIAPVFGGVSGEVGAGATGVMVVAGVVPVVLT